MLKFCSVKIINMDIILMHNGHYIIWLIWDIVPNCLLLVRPSNFKQAILHPSSQYYSINTFNYNTTL